mmetsp:Transcript_118860/g.165625  ORF Transcript_118860/g.165625 Transcript_118860/m.165625 type:complete len:220 (-) Transcript_118860:73-732(-)|eukprot:CAMPEP_0176373268 /NCGR_PEP_ID=MMETSP0126-20121128/25923_1 /TAXON_ID=141414 ORGANISM="Strombidinopsis acuminatum, Strain SPMC142" /NCGR_SAMPLE_ID=MMETSP0126 /ASSEMBLY_ACC=CAM_ASM_000229 /LENGTH=219 /DNA_ID=CAMNT_0017733345 /DNA_START=148 /DNA_END=807 /DNA_ORIENTATION=+
MTYATVRETNTDLNEGDVGYETSFMVIALTGQNIPSSGSYLGVAFKNPNETKTTTTVNPDGSTSTQTTTVSLIWDGIYCQVNSVEPTNPGLSNNLWSDSSDANSLTLSASNPTYQQAWQRENVSASGKDGVNFNCDLNGDGDECESASCVIRRELPSEYKSSDIDFEEGKGIKVVGFFNKYDDDTWTTVYSEEQTMHVLSGASSLAVAAGAALLGALAF